MAGFVDYYELLEISPNANAGTVERMFRYLAQRFHPDNPDTGDRQRFDAIMEAHETLKDPAKRAQYDVALRNQTSAGAKLVDEIGSGKGISWGLDIQNKLLSLLYVKCRQNVNEPGIGEFELQRLTGCPSEHLSFHLWYLKEKGWIRRTDGGAYAITVEGVDRANTAVEAKGPILLTDQRKAGFPPR